MTSPESILILGGGPAGMAAAMELSRKDIEKILTDTLKFKKERGHHKTQPLAGQTCVRL